MSKRFEGYKLNRYLFKFIVEILMISMTIMSLFPVWFMVSSAFKSPSEYLHNQFGPPTAPILSNFIEVARGTNIFLWLANSAMITFFSVLVSVFVASLAAYAFGKMHFRGKSTIFNLIVSLMVIPPVALVIPLFMYMVKIGLINTYFSVIVIYVGLSLPWSIYLLTSFLKTISNSIIEASRLDGCSPFQTFSKVVLPMIKPALVTIIISNSIFVWNELLIALIFLQSNSLRTLMVAISLFKSRYNINIPVTMAGLTVATSPIVILYLLLQKHFVRGLTGGSLKGG